ncbi:hypothetical protein RB594_001830 [Gaeumannomyces avenae]
MTRSEPLTSLALGRSPYDEVRMGEGEGDPRAPVQLFDEHGRPVNPDARRLNRELIRAHNEVMLAIGVAEPDDGAAERKEVEERENARMEAERIGSRLSAAAQLVEIASAWGLHGLRNRVLVYRRYSEIPFANIYHYERSRRSMTSFFLADFPTFLTMTGLRMLPQLPRMVPGLQTALPGVYNSIAHNDWLPIGVQYVRLHVHIFSFMRRLELVPQTSILPGPTFFIPFTSSSPIPCPPPISSFSPGGILGWLGGVALSFAPLAAFMLYLRASSIVRQCLRPWICQYLPSPTNKDSRDQQQLSALIGEGEQHPSDWDLIEQQQQGLLGFPHGGAAANGGDGEERTRERTAAASTDPPQVPTIRRQSTISSIRGGIDDYYDSDDEEDTERVSATLISFDVEATDATEEGVWSAELRADAPADLAGGAAGLGGGGGGGGGGGPGGGCLGQQATVSYNDNALTRLPASLAADMLTVVSSNLFQAPMEAFALRLLARTFLGRNGGSVADVYAPTPWRGVTWTAVSSLLQVEMVHLLIKGEVWSIFTLLSDMFREEIQN